MPAARTGAMFACCKRAASFTSRANRSELSPSALSGAMTFRTISRPSASSYRTGKEAASDIAEAFCDRLADSHEGSRA